MTNMVAFLLAQCGLINFTMMESSYNMAKLNMPLRKDSSGYTDPPVLQYTRNGFHPSMTAIGLVLTSLVMGRLKPKAKNLLLFNVMMLLLVVLTFCSTSFYTCTKPVKHYYKNSPVLPYCSRHCQCPDFEPYDPVCVGINTYYSPCVAGCTAFAAKGEFEKDEQVSRQFISVKNGSSMYTVFRC